MKYNFEWHPEKAETNRRKHNVSFEEATTIFKDPDAMSLYDEKNSMLEERWITLGFSNNGRILIVCHTFKEINKDSILIRIFSSRKATKQEMRLWRAK
ncbi:MAG: BrnT family toxin [Candidatus Cloacimonetes bacterium]|nr:BrnT family toxin [Candidatus Cloacimonadota bacterium]